MKTTLEQLAVPESERQRLKAEYESSKLAEKNKVPAYKILAEQRRKRKEEKEKRQNALRRFSISDVVFDILGEGEDSRLWVGRVNGEFICALDHKKVEKFIFMWLDANKDHY